MSDCPADSTLVHERVCVGNAALLTYSFYIAIKLGHVDTIMHKRWYIQLEIVFIFTIRCQTCRAACTLGLKTFMCPLCVTGCN